MVLGFLIPTLHPILPLCGLFTAKRGMVLNNSHKEVFATVAKMEFVGGKPCFIQL